jgi:hypothetical protein
MMQITTEGMVTTASSAAIRTLRTQFDRQHYVRFPRFVAPNVLQFVQERIGSGEFYQRSHENIGQNKELCMEGNAGYGALLLMVNDTKLFQTIQDVTGCSQIRCFEGRIYRVAGAAGHYDSWHSDRGDDRLVAMSINLSPEPYRGGALQIRWRASAQVVCEVPNPEPGDAIIFRLSHQLEHRITDVEGHTVKTAFAGWFKAQPDFVAMLKRAQTGRAQIHRLASR